jgi:hypothetical protein
LNLAFDGEPQGAYMGQSVHLQITMDGRLFLFVGASKKAEFKCTEPVYIKEDDILLMPPCLVYRLSLPAIQ